jgi:hypothetical protein
MAPRHGSSPRKWISRGLLLAAICAILTSPDEASADKVLVANDRFIVYRDFSDIVISPEQARSGRAYIDGGPLSSGSVTASNPEMKDIAARSLTSRVQLVPNKDDANLVIQLRMYQTANYAIRNSQREPAHGFVMVSVCKYPIATIATDCENLTYYYFEDYKAADVFETVFAMWLDSVFPARAG